MRVSDCIHCEHFPCTDTRRECYTVPDIEMHPERVAVVLISEAAPADPADFYYAGGRAGSEALFAQTTVLAFNDAGAQVTSIADILALGVYLTTAVKCGKTGYGIAASTIKECSFLLEGELALFPQAKVILAMGDVAIKALNEIARRQGAGRVIPAGSTYKIRDHGAGSAAYSFQGKRVLPSYLQAGPSFFIEKSKRRMIAEDIAAALALAA